MTKKSMFDGSIHLGCKHILIVYCVVHAGLCSTIVYYILLSHGVIVSERNKIKCNCDLNLDRMWCNNNDILRNMNLQLYIIKYSYYNVLLAITQI